MSQWLSELGPIVPITFGVVASMTLGTVVRLATLGSLEPPKRRDRLASLRTWWLIVLTIVAAAWIGPLAIGIVLAIAAAVALDEFLKLTMPEFRPRIRRGWIAWVIAVTFGPACLVPSSDFRAVAPLLIVASLVVPHLLSDSPQRYLDHVGHAMWGAIVLAWGIAHAAWLTTRPLPADDVATRIAWFLVLILLTEGNDIFQALVGRSIGRHKILPRVSPHKTWEGFLGGLVLTTLVAGAMQFGLRLEPLADLERSAPVPISTAMLLGAMIAVSGFVGDLNISCVKRDVGVKDGSDLLPGIGGMVDRVDSLSFTAPVFLLGLSLLT